MNYISALKFEERPDYELLRRMFLEVLTNMGLSNDGIFDWFHDDIGE